MNSNSTPIVPNVRLAWIMMLLTLVFALAPFSVAHAATSSVTTAADRDPSSLHARRFWMQGAADSEFAIPEQVSVAGNALPTAVQASSVLASTEVNVIPSASPVGYISLALLGIPSSVKPTDPDNGSVVMATPHFRYCGQDYNQVTMSVNGVIEVGAASGVSAPAINTTLPTAALPNNLLAPWWADLDLTHANWSSGVVTDGITEWFVIEWERVPLASDATATATFQVWIQVDNSGNIWFVYNAVAGTTGTVGAEDANGTAGDTFYFNGSGTQPSAGTELKVECTVRTDDVPPVANPSQSPAANAAVWNNTDVTVTWNWSDNPEGMGIDQDNCIQSSASNGEGEQLLTATCQDRAGNEGVAEYTVNVDKTAPVVTVTGVSNGASYTLGSVPAVGCSTTDALSGVATQATLSITGGNPDGTGSFTATCSGATDLAGNSAAAVSVNYSVQAAGVLVGSCGGYEVRQVGNSYTSLGWSGAIKVGTSGNDTLNGGSGADLILGLGGNDLLKGNGGDDVLCGGDGVDLLQGHAGNDFLDGGNGSDVLNGGSGDYDDLLAGDGNDVLLDGDGIRNAAGGAGNDLFTLALRNGWRDATGQPHFAGLSGGYGNDLVGLAILNPVSFLVDITGDERDNPASPLEGNNDSLALAGVIDPASTLIKFEQQVVLSATNEAAIPGEESGAEYLTEPVGEEAVAPTEQANRLFLPLVNR